MTVFILELAWDYEGATILGVYDNKLKAIKAMRSYHKQNTSGDFYEVTEVDMNKKASDLEGIRYSQEDPLFKMSIAQLKKKFK